MKLWRSSFLPAMLFSPKQTVAHSTMSALDTLIPSRYESIPKGLTLQKVVIFHRHGDRAQISKSLGNAYPVNECLTEDWKQFLPTQSTKEALRSVAVTNFNGVLCHFDSLDVDKSLYNGWDVANIPYGQLTDLGAQQLISLGQRIRAHYPSFLPQSLEDAVNHVYCRSTHFCRTDQSLRGLLTGLFTPNPANLALTNAELLDKVPTIIMRPKHEETLFPQGDVNCSALSKRRNEIYSEEILQSYFPDTFVPLQQRMQALFDFPEGKVAWLTIKEVCHCQAVHNLQHVSGITAEEVSLAGEIATRVWSILFRDKLLNSFTMGRFYHELLCDMADNADENPLHDKKMLIYSGHDSTVVPILCALQAFDDKWPEYASSVIFEICHDKTRQEQVVRVVYNNRPMRCFGQDREWLPWSDFQNRLRELSLSPEAYHALCQETGKEGEGTEVEKRRKAQVDFEREVVGNNNKESAD